MQHIPDIDTIVRMYAGDEYAELQKWQDDDVLNTSIQTLCDVRRHVEVVFGAWNTSNSHILQALYMSGGRVFRRHETDIVDMCAVDIDSVIQYIRTNVYTSLVHAGI